MTDREMLEFINKAVLNHFDGKVSKWFLWMTTPNPLLGNTAPLSMVALGRIRKLHKFVENTDAGEAINADHIQGRSHLSREAYQCPKCALILIKQADVWLCTWCGHTRPLT